MEYKKYYEYFYNKTYVIGERKIKQTLIKSKAKSLVFYLNLNIILDTQNLLISKKSNILLFDSLNELDTIFVNSIYDYTENNEELTLKNNVYPEYLKIKNDQLPSNYSFNKFLSDFGALKGLIDVVKKFQENSNQYQKMYEENNFSNFKIPKRNIIIQNTPINLTPPEPKLKSQINGDYNNLKEDQKAFLFHIMCVALSEKKEVKKEEKEESVLFNLPYTELIRLNSLIDFIDKYCFEKNFRDSNNYKILTKGLNHFEKTERIIFLLTLVDNIKIYQLPKTTKYIKTILNNEHNKSEKMKMK
ncbi:hypothetical protein [Flavobacterium sp. LB2P44]|uniref:hypothetical protein n=1 Tax=Flavobacterium sp. LB2P44 TaxID=3401713 RepID=UPI003AAF83AB